MLNYCPCCSVTSLYLTVCNLLDYSTPGFPLLHHLPEFAQTHVHWVGDAIQPSLSSVVPFSWLQSSLASGSFPMSQLFTSGSQSIGASASASSPSNEYSWLISFRIDWFDLAVQGTLKSFLQHHNSKKSILWHSAFLMVQFSYPYMTTGKTKALTKRNLHTTTGE